MKDKTNLVLVGLIVILGVFALGIYLSDTINITGNYYYSNGETDFFVEKDGANNRVYFYYEEDPQPYFINMNFGPTKVEDIFIDDGVYSLIRYADAIFVTLDPYAGLDSGATVAALEMDGVIDNEHFFNVPFNMSLTKEYKDYPIRDCSDATSSEVVVLLELGEETAVNVEDSCIIITGKDEDELIKAADRLVYQILGIIP